MLIPQVACVYVDNETEWEELMVFLKEHDCLIGEFRNDPTTARYSTFLDAIRIFGDRFLRGKKDSYRDRELMKMYQADPAWWLIHSTEFIERHNGPAQIEGWEGLL